jgi:hypothetical protein
MAPPDSVLSADSLGSTNHVKGGYSDRSAMVGSMRIARAMGIAWAANATVNKTTVTLTNVSGSRAPTL